MDSEESSKNSKKEEENISKAEKYKRILAMTTALNVIGGVMGRDRNGHTGTQGTKCKECGEYLTFERV